CLLSEVLAILSWVARPEVLRRACEPPAIRHALRSTSGRATQCYSHSIVAGGLLLISYTTRFTPFTSLMIRVEILASKSYGRCDQSAVMKSSVCTARMATTFS